MLLELKMNQTQQQQQSSSGLMYNAAGQPVVCQTVDTTQPPQAYELYNSHQSKIAGVMLIVVGALAIVLNGIGIGLHEYGTLAGHGFWAGIMVSKFFCIFRSTSESRPNSTEGKNVRPPVRPYVRPSVRPSVHKKFLQFE